MKTILQVCGTMNRGGAEMMLMELIRHLRADFRFVFLINRKKGTQPAGDFDEELRSYGIPLYYIDAVWDVGPWEYARQFREIAAQIGPIDAVHSHVNSKSGVVSLCAAKCGIPRRIAHSHAKLVFGGSFLSRAANTAELLIQRLWINRYATDYWGCSPEALRSLFTRRQCESHKAQIIHNAIDVAAFSSTPTYTVREELGLGKDALVIGTVGRIARVKNYELAADIIEALWKQGVSCHYVVAGRKQDADSCAYLFDRLGNDSRFHYLGVRSDLSAVYHGFDIYLGTSRREGLGLSAVEAQACGTYCVLSQGFPRLCDVGAGLVAFAESSDPAEWSRLIAEKLGDIPGTPPEAVAAAVRAAGFDIAQEAARVKALYLQ